MTSNNSLTGTLTVVGIGPGATDLLAPRARLAIEQAEVVAGYRTYLDLIAVFLRPDQEILSSAMRQEIDRCRRALAFANSGRSVALVCGGDPGIYALAGLVYELARETNSACRIEVIPGIAALNACAAVLGAPLMHDFAAISLSDLMTPWEQIKNRAKLAAEGDFVIAIYNPKSRGRATYLDEIRDIVLQYRKPETPVGIVRKAGRPGMNWTISTLEKLPEEHVDMQSTVIIGKSTTFVADGKMITPRGYKA